MIIDICKYVEATLHMPTQHLLWEEKTPPNITLQWSGSLIFGSNHIPLLNPKLPPFLPVPSVHPTRDVLHVNLNSLLTEMLWTTGELWSLQWETIYYLAGASGELHCLVWEESKGKVWCSLKWITQPRINLSLIHVDTDSFHFCYTELITRECTSSCIYDIQIPYQSWWNVPLIVFAFCFQMTRIKCIVCTHCSHWKLMFTKKN